jgi:hypothetical protein
MPSYEITFRDAHRKPEIVHADGVRRSRTAVVFYATRLVVFDPAREIVVRRYGRPGSRICGSWATAGRWSRRTGTGWSASCCSGCCAGRLARTCG